MKKLSNVTLTPLQATRFLKIFIRLKNTYEIHVEGDESKDEIKTMEEAEKVKDLLMKKILKLECF